MTRIDILAIQCILSTVRQFQKMDAKGKDQLQVDKF